MFKSQLEKKHLSSEAFLNCIRSDILEDPFQE